MFSSFVTNFQRVWISYEKVRSSVRNYGETIGNLRTFQHVILKGVTISLFHKFIAMYLVRSQWFEILLR